MRCDWTVIRNRLLTAGIPIRKHRKKEFRCRHCGKSIFRTPSGIPKNPNNIFCNKNCYNKFLKEKRITVECAACGKILERSSYRAKNSEHYCGTECYAGGKGNGAEEIKCDCCGKKFWRSRVHKYNFCSAGCRRKFKKPKPYYSTLEWKLKEVLEKNNINFIFQYQLNNYKFDFYLPKENILIETDGTYWHGKDKENWELDNRQKVNRRNGLIKDRLAENCGYKLIRIWEDEIENFNVRNLVSNIYLK